MVVEVEGGRVAIRVDSAVLLTLSRSDAWKLAEALDALSMQQRISRRPEEPRCNTAPAQAAN